MANLRVDKITSTETFETTGSVQFDGNNDKLIVGSAGDFNYLHNGAASFTAEFWVYTEIANQRQVVFSTGGNSSSTGFVVRIMASGAAGSSNGYLVGAQTSKSSSGNYLYWDSESTQLAANTWYHIATVYDHTDNTLKIYVDGKLTNSGLSRTYGNFGDHATGNSHTGIYIGEEAYNNSLDLNGFVSNLRIINGVKLYTSNFKPPMKELEVTPGTTVLCCQSKTNELLEKTGKTIVMNGTAAAGGLTPGLLTPVPKAGAGSAITGSVEFGGTADYLGLPTTTDFTFGTNDFTIEFWLNPGENPTNYTIIFSLTTDTAAKRFEVAYHSNSIRVYTDTATWRDTGIEPLKGEWHHFAFVRNYSGNSLIMYVNGINKWEVTNTRNYDELVKIPRIGSYASGSYGYLQGFLSNFRIVRGAALYTDNFTPPTRELKKVPGTVLLCCQDPNNPLTEATGKTITGYGSLYQVDPSINLADYGTWVDGSTGAGSASESNGQITMQGNGASDRGIITKTVTVVPNITYEMSFNVTDAASNGKTGLDSNDGTNDVLDDPTATLDMVHFSGAALDGNTGTFKVRGVATTTECVMYFQEFGAAGTTNFIVDTISLRAVGGGNKGASNFTPQVGDGRKVTFEGVTKINSDAYFYLPTGDTVTRNTRSGRGVLGGGRSPSSQNIIDFVNIASTGNAQDFGDLTRATMGAGACSSVTRGLFGSGASPGADNTIEFVTIATTGNAQNFGDLTYAPQACGAVSNNTRGIFAGGEVSSNSVNTINFVTIASTGDAKDFGDLVQTRRQFIGSCSSPTRGLFAGGYQDPASTRTNAIEFITISSTGNGIDFGDLTTTVDKLAGVSSKTRGVFAGGFSPSSPNRSDTIAYVTIASTGDAIDFGDLIVETFAIGGGASNSERGLYTGGATPSVTNAIDYITIASTGDAKDFGDLVMARRHPGGVSDSHGGLG